MPAIKAIETSYSGHRFRSRTEARWAVFFDEIGEEWAYEAEGFELGSPPIRYLPDFWLPRLDCWVEVKPPGPLTDFETKKASLLSACTGKLVFVLHDCGPIKLSNDDVFNSGTYFAPDGDADGCMEFGVCRVCDEICLGHFGWHSVYCNPKYERKTNCRRPVVIGLDHPQRLIDAYSKARSFRFGRIA
jgi:hypothetical protein